jgi:hypothetical protein
MEERMRSTLAAFGLFSLMTLTGCADNWGFLRKESKLADGNNMPSAEQLVTLLNNNAKNVHSLSCQDVELDVQQGMQAFGLTGKIACEQPRDFRMMANSPVVGKGELDLGSNDREFWFWIGRNNPPYQFYCSYEDLRTKNVPLPFPVQPEWVMETLGMANYPINGQYKVELRRDTIELIQDATSPQGQPVKKVVVFDRHLISSKPIRAYELRDRENKEVCSARILDVQRVGNATVPYKLVLSWPKDNSKLTLKLNKPTINQVSPEAARSLFTRTPLRGIQSYDLASQVRESSVQQAGGVLR